jgi:LL-diaminopimelate aminotransferase
MLLAPASVVDSVIKVKSNVDSGMFLAIQAGATAAFSNSDEWHQSRNAVYTERRQVVWELLSLLGLSFSRDQVGLFVWAKAPDSIPAVPTFADEILNEAHVFFTPGFIFGSRGDRYVRASLCAPRERLCEAVDRIRLFVKKRPGAGP